MTDIRPPSPPGAQNRQPGPVTVSRPGDMAWSGIQTFAKVPLCLTPADLRAGGADVAIGGAPWEGTAPGRTRAPLGPRAIPPGGYPSPGPWDPPGEPVDPSPRPDLVGYRRASALDCHT